MIRNENNYVPLPNPPSLSLSLFHTPTPSQSQPMYNDPLTHPILEASFPSYHAYAPLQSAKCPFPFPLTLSLTLKRPCSSPLPKTPRRPEQPWPWKSIYTALPGRTKFM